MNENGTQTSNKKTTIFISIAIAIILLAIVGGTIFCIKTCNLEPAPTEFSMVGVWKMYTRAENFENNDNNVKYLEFSESSVKIFDGVSSTTPSKTTNYSLDLVANELVLSDLNLEYKVLGRYADCFVAIALNPTTEFALVKCNDKSLNGNYDKLYGEWKAIVKDKEEVDQKIVIDNVALSIYQAKETKPIISSDYQLTSDGIIILQASPTSPILRYEIAYLSETQAILVELGGAGKFGASVYILVK